MMNDFTFCSYGGSDFISDMLLQHMAEFFIYCMLAKERPAGPKRWLETMMCTSIAKTCPLMCVCGCNPNRTHIFDIFAKCKIV